LCYYVRMKTIAIANHKGGTGKSASTHTMGAGLAANGRKVLMIDLDPQASLTRSCGLLEAAGTMADVLGGANKGTAKLNDIAQEISEGLYIAPADIVLSTSEIGIRQRQVGADGVLKKAIADVSNLVDVCLIDCPPNLGTLTINALVAADAVLIPTQPSPVDMRGLAGFMQFVDQVKEVNPALVILGVLTTFFDNSIKSHQNAIEAMLESGWPVLDVKIGKSVRVAEAAANGETVLTFEPENPQAANYWELVKEVEKWLMN